VRSPCAGIRLCCFLNSLSGHPRPKVIPQNLKSQPSKGECLEFQSRGLSRPQNAAQQLKDPGSRSTFVQIGVLKSGCIDRGSLGCRPRPGHAHGGRRWKAAPASPGSESSPLPRRHGRQPLRASNSRRAASARGGGCAAPSAHGRPSARAPTWQPLACQLRDEVRTRGLVTQALRSVRRECSCRRDARRGNTCGACGDLYGTCHNICAFNAYGELYGKRDTSETNGMLVLALVWKKSVTHENDLRESSAKAPGAESRQLFGT